MGSDRDMQLRYDNLREPDPDDHNWREIPSGHMVVCSWCGATLRDGTEPISHGICEFCSADILEKVRGRKKR